MRPASVFSEIVNPGPTVNESRAPTGAVGFATGGGGVVTPPDPLPSPTVNAPRICNECGSHTNV